MKFLRSLALFFFDILDKYIHQKRILNYIREVKSEINILVDVGSHKGLYTDLILKNFKVKKAFLFEPQEKIFKFIKNKYKKIKKILVHNYAISNEVKFKNFYINQHDLTSSLTQKDPHNFYLKLKSLLFGGTKNNMITKTSKIKTTKLSNIIKKNKIKKIDLLKIDTEGHELQVLLGLEEKVKIVKVILIEVHNDNIYLKYNSNKIHNYLIKNKFVLKKKINFPFTTWEDRIYLNKIR